MTEFTNRYYPTIALRRGEMRAFSKLPDSEKGKIFPILLLAPWLNSIKFENSFRVIHKCVGDQKIIVDLDRYYQSSSLLESRTYFWSLLEKDSGPEKWMKLVEAHQNYIPCLQTLGVAKAMVQLQIEWARQLGRGFCFRYELERYDDFASEIDALAEVAEDDCLIILDFGYSDDVDGASAKINQILEKIFDISSNFRVTICGSNFPNDFSDFDDFAQSQPIAARAVYEKVRAIFGNYKVYYGDWASTKPRKYDGGGSPPLPRIDFPMPTRWIIARSKGEDWSLDDAALRITRLPEWLDRPIVWGTGMIEKTAKGLPGRIKTHPEAIAARINIHLFIQANYGGSGFSMQPKGKWVDPI